MTTSKFSPYSLDRFMIAADSSRHLFTHKGGTLKAQAKKGYDCYVKMLESGKQPRQIANTAQGKLNLLRGFDCYTKRDWVFWDSVRIAANIIGYDEAASENCTRDFSSHRQYLRHRVRVLAGAGIRQINPKRKR